VVRRTPWRLCCRPRGQGLQLQVRLLRKRRCSSSADPHQMPFGTTHKRGNRRTRLARWRRRDSGRQRTVAGRSRASLCPGAAEGRTHAARRWREGCEGLWRAASGRCRWIRPRCPASSQKPGARGAVGESFSALPS